MHGNNKNICCVVYIIMSFPQLVQVVAYFITLKLCSSEILFWLWFTWWTDMTEVHKSVLMSQMLCYICRYGPFFCNAISIITLIYNLKKGWVHSSRNKNIYSIFCDGNTKINPQNHVIFSKGSVTRHRSWMYHFEKL